MTLPLPVTLPRWPEQVGPPLDPTTEQGRRLLREELARPRYDLRPGLLERLQDWVGRLLSGSPDVGVPGWLLPVVVALVLAAVALVVVRLVRPERRVAPGVGRGGVLEERGVDAAAYRLRAERALAAGDARTALLDGFRALTRRSVERALLEDLPGRTAHEVAVELTSAFPAAETALRTSADTFDAVRYGGRGASEGQARAVLDLDAALARTSPGAAGRPAANAMSSAAPGSPPGAGRR